MTIRSLSMILEKKNNKLIKPISRYNGHLKSFIYLILYFNDIVIINTSSCLYLKTLIT